MRRAPVLTLALLLAAGARAHAQSSAPASAPGCSALRRPFIGTICVPRDHAGRHPAIILLGGSDGGDSMAPLAPLFAARGYVAASVAYFGLPGLPAHLVNVPVETVGRALAALQRRDDVAATRIGILGVSKGGEFALLAASTYPSIKAVVGVVPSPVAFMGLGANDIATGCSWSRDGKPLPCVPPDEGAAQQIGMAFYEGKPVALKPFYDASLRANPAVTKAAFFALQRIRGPLLCLAAADDRLWDSPLQCKMALDALRGHHHPFADRMIVYPRAGHLFLTARTLATAVTSYDVGGVTLDFGGTPRGDVAAAHAAWAAIWSFFAKAL